MQPPVVKPTPIAGARVLFVMATEHEYGAHLKARMTPLVTGVGPVEAAIGTATCLQHLQAGGERVDLVVSLGSAGSRRCPVGSVHQIDSVSWRDMDASRIGFAKGVTPFADFPAVMPLPALLPGLSCASLSTGADIVGGEDYARIDADLVDMETYAVLRACQRMGVPMIGLRGVSDGPGELDGLSGWTQLLAFLDERLAEAVDDLFAVLSAEPAPEGLTFPPIPRA
ncbi:5'-methylthioadenosine/S-adenosylhomocysteine nucleosidase [Novosphingobium resinovorum]|uniref:5'-methylthioadenosine/S-adenosylhomocysteine nucleosidase n=1 Tax=Novosphingobium resinovorum TaxID=158500 RepID=UPI002ED630DC|nr:5'-methylthioadenosine/S-adenosylhomocysteine nucleosidase [Novosphingobium resinovorum]